MSFLTEYKDEVGSITLSAEFKENLKKLCIAEAEKSADKGGESPQIEVSETKSSQKDVYSRMKLYKYISIAACLVAVISSVGVISLMSSRIKTRGSFNQAMMTDGFVEDGVDTAEAISEEDISEDDVSSSADEPVSAQNGLDPMYGEPTESSEELDYAPAEEPIPDASFDVGADYEEPDDASDDINTYSVSMNSPDYDGDYNTEDYVLMLNSSAAAGSANVFDSDEDLIDSAGLRENETENSVPTASGYNALNFYDILASRLKEESRAGGASLVRMTVMGTADSGSAPSPSSNAYTPYDVNIEYDYLNQTSCDVDAVVWIKGTEDDQISGMPTYSEGDVILTSLYVNSNGSVTVIDELLYDVYNLSGQDIAYHRNYDKINPGYTDMGILDEERSFVTTTENNPVQYVHKAVTKELSRYIRRKIVGESYDFVDLEWLGKVSVGEAEPWTEPDEPDEPAPDDTQTPEDEQPAPEVKPIKNARVTVSDDRMVITSAGQQIYLYDAESCEYIESLFRNSASSISSYTASSTAMFVGGKLTFNSAEAFSGEIIEIEITSVGCPLNISFKGVSVGDSIESAAKAFGIKETLDQNCTLTYKGDTITATMNFQYGTLAKLVIK